MSVRLFLGWESGVVLRSPSAKPSYSCAAGTAGGRLAILRRSMATRPLRYTVTVSEFDAHQSLRPIRPQRGPPRALRRRSEAARQAGARGLRPLRPTRAYRHGNGAAVPVPKGPRPPSPPNQTRVTEPASTAMPGGRRELSAAAARSRARPSVMPCRSGNA